MTCKKDNLRQCKPSGSNFKRLEDVVDAYINEHRERVESELRFYAEKKSFLEVASLAATAKGPWNGIHDHQKRVGGLKLAEFAQRLLKVLPKLEKSTNFEELYNAIEAKKIEGVGKLTVYDTALRIGAFLKIEPENVYLHRGAKEGAENLGVDLRGRRSIPASELATVFRKLKPCEIEDCLCIYKDSFKDRGVL